MFYNTSINQIHNINIGRRICYLLELPEYSIQKPMVYVTPNEIKLIIKKLPKKLQGTIASRILC